MAEYSFRSDARINDFEREKLREFCSTLDREIVQLANALGLKVFDSALLPYERGYLENSPSHGSASGWIVKVNGKDRAEVRSFTIAHEIGHFILHRGHMASLDVFDGRMNRSSENAIDPFVYLDPRDQQLETEANLFAATLLMPSNLFKPAHKRLAGDVGALARLFFVTEEAVRRRIRELGL